MDYKQALKNIEKGKGIGTDVPSPTSSRKPLNVETALQNVKAYKPAWKMPTTPTPPKLYGNGSIDALTSPTFAEYNKAATDAGKKDLSVWSKISSIVKRGGGATLNYLQSKNKENEEASFKMRQMLYSRKGDPIRFVTDENGNRIITNNALESFEQATTEEEKAAIISADQAEIPLQKALKTPLGRKIVALPSKTENLPLKALARLVSVGDSTYEEARDRFIKAGEDPTNPDWQRWLYQFQEGLVPTVLGTILAVGTGVLTRNPKVGTTVGGSYFSAMSANEELDAIDRGEKENVSFGNVAVDTIGDNVLGGIFSHALRNFAKDSTQRTLTNTFKQGVKGAGVEGLTEPSQSFIKFGNDYREASTEEEKKAVEQRFAQYMQSDAWLDEMIVGGLTGGSLNLLASRAGRMSAPILNKENKELTVEEIDTAKESVKTDIDKALDNDTLPEVITVVSEKLNIPEESAITLVQEVAQDIVAENTDREAPEGSAEETALQTDIVNLLEAGVNPADISIALAEQTSVSSDYAQSAVARALAKLNAKVDEANAKLDNIDENTQKKQEDASALIAAKLLEKGVEQEVIDQVSKPLAVAISGRGTPKQKLEAIALLSDPANADSRAVYEEEMGIELPATQEESEVYLKRTVNKSKSRQTAEKMVMFELDRSEAGYRGSYGSHDATKENGGVTAFKVSSTFPDWIPSELRSKDLFNKVSPAIDTGKRPKEGKRAYKQAQLYDLIQGKIAQYEADLENSAYDMSEPTEDIDPNIPFQVANAQIQDESLISNEETEREIRQYFSAEEIPIVFVDKIRTPRGLEAWGMYSKGVITFINNPRSDTPSHETVHAFLDNFVPEKLRQKYLDTAYAERVEKLGQEQVDIEVANLAKRYNDKLDSKKIKEIYAEETLADAFIEYVRGRNQKTKLQQFFDRVIAFLKSIADINDSQKLYEDIIARKRENRKQYDKALKAAGEPEFYTEDGKKIPIIPASALYQAGNRIHEEDRDVLDAFIRHARTDAKLSDADFNMASSLAEKWGISMDKPLKTIANTFEKILDDKKRVTGTILYSEKEARTLTTRLLKKLEGRNIVSKQFISDLTNSPDLKQVEKDLVRSVLETQGDKVNVPEFTEKVVAELLPLTVKSSDVVNDKAKDHYASNYMVNEGEFSSKYEQVSLPENLRGKVATYVENIYESPIKTSAGDVHFNYNIKNYFGHTRIEDMADGETRRVIEVQSDLYQKGNLEKERYDIEEAQRNVDLAKKQGKSEGLIASFEFDLEKTLTRKREVDALARYTDPTAHFRMIREEMKKAAQDGKTVVQFPTGETAMKIEGLAGGGNPNFLHYEESTALKESDLVYGQKFNDQRHRAGASNFIVLESAKDGVFNAIPLKSDAPEILQESNYGEFSDEYLAELKKYAKKYNSLIETLSIAEKIDTDNPIYRFYEKEVAKYLKNKYKMTPVTDEKGVTWYQVEVEQQFATEPVEAFSEKDPVSFVRSKTFALQPFQNLSEKVSAFKKATSENTETHAYTLGKETKKIESAQLQKIVGKTDGMNTESYAVLVDDQVVFISEKIEDSAKWLADHAGKSTTIEQNATSTLFVDGNEAYVIVTSKDLIPLEIGNIQGTTDVETIKFYSTRGEIIETHVVTGDGTFRPINLTAEATRNNATRITFPSYFAAIAGRPVLVKNDVPQKTVTAVEKPAKSRFFDRMVAKLDEANTDTVTYDREKQIEQLAKAQVYYETDKNKTIEIALGELPVPEDVNEFAVSLVVLENAKEQGDNATIAKVLPRLSLEATKAGQKISMLRNAFGENDPMTYISQLIQYRALLAKAKYKAVFSRTSTAKPIDEQVQEKVKVARKKTQKLADILEIKSQEIDVFLQSLAC